MKSGSSLPPFAVAPAGEVFAVPGSAGTARPSWWLVGVVMLFLVESLLSRTHLQAVLLTTPIHIVVTAGLSGAMLAVAALKGLVPPPTRIALPLTALIVLAFLSSAYSPSFTVFNLLFATVWMLHFGAVWWAVPSLLREADVDLIMDLFLVLFVLVLVLSLLFVGPARAGRFAGFFNTATQIGRIGALAVVCAFAEWILGRRRSLWMLVMAVATVMVLMSRTRASMGAMVLGCAVVLALYLFSPVRGHRLRAGLAFFGVFGAAAAFFFVVDFGLLRIDGFVQYLRLSGGITGVLAARQEIWMAGFERIGDAGWLGAGFSEKFGGFAAEKWGITYPTYDWTELVDPHNMLMTTAIQNGLPAMVVLAVVVLAVGLELQRLPLRQRALGSGLFAVGLIFGLADGNWFITFSPPDRISMTLLALLLASRFHPDPGEAPAEPP